MTIEVWDFDPDSNHDEIDVLVKSIPVVVNNNKIKIEEVGRNNLGWFNLTYHMQSLKRKISNESSIDSVRTTTITKPVPTTCSTSVPVINSTDQQLAESSSSHWTCIAGAVLFLLLAILFLTVTIILMCVVRNMSKELKKFKRERTGENDGEQTCIVFEVLAF